jgi:predicted TIM-barrel fold metal-dependent hydrolase
MAARRIDVHFHLIPKFYADMVYAAGSGPAIGRYPDWSESLALEIMDQFDIATALLSLGQPGVQFCKADQAKALARRCNDYCAELNAKHGKRFGAFGTVSTCRGRSS